MKVIQKVKNALTKGAGGPPLQSAADKNPIALAAIVEKGCVDEAPRIDKTPKC